MHIKFDNYADIGRYLRECRESLRLTTRGISAQLHIRAKYLEALESGQLSDIPGTVYTKGYLAAYAEFLGVDKTSIIKAFDQLGKEPQKRRMYVSIPTAKENIPDKPMVVFSLLFVLGLCIVWALARPEKLEHREVADVPSYMLRMLEPRKVQVMSPVVYRPECSLAFEEGHMLFCSWLALNDQPLLPENRKRRWMMEIWE